MDGRGGGSSAAFFTLMRRWAWSGCLMVPWSLLGVKVLDNVLERKLLVES